MYLPIYIIYCISFALIGIVIWLLSMLHGQSHKNTSSDPYKEANKILEHAHTKAAQIIEHATDRSKSILLDTEYLRQQLRNDLEKEYHDVHADHRQRLEKAIVESEMKFQEILLTIQEDYKKEAQNILKGIKDTQDSEIEDFKNILAQQTVQSQEEVSRQIHDVFVNAQSEIDKYKKEQLVKIQQKMASIIQAASLAIMGEALTLEQKEKMVLDAIEKAADEHFFS